MPSLKSLAKKASSSYSKKDGFKNPFSSGLLKLKIKSCDDPDTTKVKKDDGAKLEFVAQFNPTKIDEGVKIEFTETKASGSTEGVKKFFHVNSTELTLNLTLDGTGVASMSSTVEKTELNKDDTFVTKQIDLFKKVTRGYDGEKHDIPYVNIVWGKLDFKGRLTQLDISHVLFNSQGKPLRSTLSATFSSASSLETQAKVTAKSSPDLTHIRTVRTGDTLPLMCQTIYNDSSYYLKVAKFNNLVDFRNLEPGSEIIFPPVL